MVNVRIFTSTPCGYCSAAKRFFTQRSISSKGIDLTGNVEERRGLLQRTGQRTVPQIFIGETHVGGYTDLVALASRGELDALLDPEPRAQ